MVVEFPLSFDMSISYFEEHFSLATTHSLVYRVGAMVPLAQLALARKLSDSCDRISDIEALEERGHNSENKWLSYKKILANHTTSE